MVNGLRMVSCNLICNLVVFVEQSIHHGIFHLILLQLLYEPTSVLIYKLHTVNKKKLKLTTQRLNNKFKVICLVNEPEGHVSNSQLFHLFFPNWQRLIECMFPHRDRIYYPSSRLLSNYSFLCEHKVV